jgi:hypothetical protein
MRIFNKFRGTKGWLWLYERQLQLACMHNQQEAEQRLRVLIFWEKHGDEATMEAFSISRRTLYRWQELLRKNEGKLVALDKKSTAPKKKRVRIIPVELVERIITLRRDHHRHREEVRLRRCIHQSLLGVCCGLSQETNLGGTLQDLGDPD